MKLKRVALAMLLLTASPASAQEVRVMLNDEGEDACSVGVMHKLGDGYTSLRAGPGTQYARIHRMYEGVQVSICDEKGRWYGIVFGGDECVGGSPKAKTQNGPYSGPCKSGWAKKGFVTSIAG